MPSNPFQCKRTNKSIKSISLLRLSQQHTFNDDSSIRMIETLLSEVSALRATIANMQTTNRERKYDTPDTTIYSEDNMVPLLKRSRGLSQDPTRRAPSAAPHGRHLDLFTARARGACSLTPPDSIWSEASPPTPRSAAPSWLMITVMWAAIEYVTPSMMALKILPLQLNPGPAERFLETELFEFPVNMASNFLGASL
ncbi:hypothetical protein B0H16DRAFT_1469555 [Mycena metata]|uniref:Uncharacterized protein n=1 Tax=Mycena metata TaxID=1033252 RepID=A0AAD7MS11_9AGAR|nr:hypothetical protein B0H16DRAFT_1469555 [Mycena metata]